MSAIFVIACNCVLFFPSLVCYIFVVSVWLRVRSLGCLRVCARSILWAPELCSFFFVSAVVDVLYFYCVRVRVRSRACACVVIFVSACNSFFFLSSAKFAIVRVIYFVVDARAIFVSAYNFVLFFPRCWYVMFFFVSAWLRVRARDCMRSRTLPNTRSHAFTRTPHSITRTHIHSHSALSLTH